ncbi:MAG: LacI family DNA-binding transcriptional regulator [Saprospiraceae bacterium]|nr:LacI family DNA-binding transcriptional regulator [Saprospiraceae bacterium]
MKRTGIKDLAKLLSLNPSTISRALSDHPDISPETKSRVKKAAIEFNYLPNLHARYFRQKNSGLIALILPEFNMFFIPELMEGINSVIVNSGYSMIIFFSDNSIEREKEIISHCLSWVVEGVLISVSETTFDCDHFYVLKNAGIPVVMLDKVIFSPEFTSVTIDDKVAAFNGTKHLIDNDKQNILGIFGNPRLEITKNRLAGFKECLSNHHILHSDYDIVYLYHDFMNTDVLEEKLRKTPFDAVFFMSDELFMTVYPTLLKLNLFPEKTSIVAISDGKMPYQIYPRISHIKHSGFEIGKTAAEALLRRMQGVSEIQHIEIETTLVSLESVFI